MITHHLLFDFILDKEGAKKPATLTAKEKVQTGTVSVHNRRERGRGGEREGGEERGREGEGEKEREEKERGGRREGKGRERGANRVKFC